MVPGARKTGAILTRPSPSAGRKARATPLGSGLEDRFVLLRVPETNVPGARKTGAILTLRSSSASGKRGRHLGCSGLGERSVVYRVPETNMPGARKPSSARRKARATLQVPGMAERLPGPLTRQRFDDGYPAPMNFAVVGFQVLGRVKRYLISAG